MKQLDIKRATGEFLPHVFMHRFSSVSVTLTDMKMENRNNNRCKTVTCSVLRVSERRALICLRGVVQDTSGCRLGTVESLRYATFFLHALKDLQDAYPTTLQEDEASIF